MKKYLRYLLQKNKRLFVMFTILFVVVHSLFLLLYISQYTYINRFEDNLYNARSFSVVAIIVLVILINIMPVIIQKKQMNITSADLIYSIPIKREKCLFSEIIFGWIVVFIPFIISCILVLLIMSMSISLNLIMLTSYFIYCIIITSAWYLFNVFIVSKCNSIRDALIIEVLYTLIFILILTQSSVFFFWNSINVEAASAIIGKLNYVLEFIFPINGLIAQNFLNNGWMLSIAYLIYCVLFLALIKKSIKNKQAEKIGDISESKLLYPLTLNIIIVIILISSENNNFDMTSIAINLKYLVFLFICYIIGNFIAQRQFKIRAKHILLFIVCITISYAFRYAYIQSACFNEAYSYREIKDVDKIYITYTLFGYYEDLTYDLIGIDENLDVVMDTSLKIQDDFVKEYKESNHVSMIDSSKDGYIRIQYIHRGNKTTSQEYTYYITNRDVQKITRLFNEYDLSFEPL